MTTKVQPLDRKSAIAQPGLHRRILLPLVWIALLAVMPFLLNSFFIGVASSVLIWVIIGIGVMVLLGYSGQVSIGHAAFLAMGAYGEALLIQNSVPFPLSLVIVALCTLVIGVAVGLPSLRFSGLYLAMATLAFAFIVEAVIGGIEMTGGRGGMSVDDATIFGHSLSNDLPMFYTALVIAALVFWLANNLVGSRTGRAWQAIRDSEIAATSMGISIARYKTIAFAFSASVTAVAGTLLAHKVGYLSPDGFTIQQSIEMLILVVVGGLGSLMGAIYGALFIVLLPVLLSLIKDQLPPAIAELPGLEAGVFGLSLMLVILFQPGGINSAVTRLLALIGGRTQ
ncbi:branched-chain amino acid ABC transporter permease [Rhodoligotrophos ferricapiens]|uniref:branched-chain amino acid ABC transporter permease n=1 Tax=Rhodoligotrophos ferricapiens TaxID=3069264 RepID=UPI00315D5EA5